MPWMGLVTLLVCGAVLAWVLLVAHTTLGLLRPPRRGYANAVSKGWPGNPSEMGPELGGPFAFREWMLPLEGTGGTDGKLAAWEVEGCVPRGPVVVWSHGWGESRVHGLLRLSALAKFARAVVLYDLRGHGESGGWCALGTREVDDLLLIAERAASTGGGDSRVVLGGFSLGAGVSIAAAARAGTGAGDDRSGGPSMSVVGVIAEAPYRLPATPVESVVRGTGLSSRWTLGPALALAGWVQGQGWRWVGEQGEFDRATLAERLRVPLLVLHGTSDQVCPPVEGEAIAGAARDSGCEARLVEVPGGGHVDLWTVLDARKTCAGEVEAFVRAAGISPDAAHPA